MNHSPTTAPPPPATDELDVLERGRRVLGQVKVTIDAIGVLRIKDRLDAALRYDQKVRSHTCYMECAPPTPEHDTVALMVRDLCAADLGIEPPELHWMTPETDYATLYAIAYGHRDWPHVWYPKEDCVINGVCTYDDGHIWINADATRERPLRDVLATVAHEVRHAAGGDEDAAYAYGPTWHGILTRLANAADLHFTTTAAADTEDTPPPASTPGAPDEICTDHRRRH